MDRQAYIDRTKALLDEWNAEIDKVKAKVDAASAEARIEYEKRLEEMRGHRNEAEAQLHKLQASGDQAFDDLRHGFEKAWADISTAFKGAASRFDK